MQVLLLITNTEDGEPRAEVVEQRKFLERLAQGYYNVNPAFMKEIPKEPDITQWEPGVLLLLRCEVVVPKPVMLVTEYQLP